MNHNLTAEIENLPRLQLVMDSLDWKDMLFLLLGLASAFRLASRGFETT